MALGMGYTDFWAIIGSEDAAQAFEKGATASYEGSHPLYVCEDENALGMPSAMLARLFFPKAAVTQPLDYDLAGSTFAATRVPAVDMLPLEFPMKCP